MMRSRDYFNKHFADNQADVFSYSAVISACEKCFQWALALHFFQEMSRKQVTGTIDKARRYTPSDWPRTWKWWFGSDSIFLGPIRGPGLFSGSITLKIFRGPVWFDQLENPRKSGGDVLHASLWPLGDQRCRWGFLERPWCIWCIYTFKGSATNQPVYVYYNYMYMEKMEYDWWVLLPLGFHGVPFRTFENTKLRCRKLQKWFKILYFEGYWTWTVVCTILFASKSFYRGNAGRWSHFDHFVLGGEKHNLMVDMAGMVCFVYWQRRGKTVLGRSAVKEKILVDYWLIP